MPNPNAITPAQLMRLVGTPDAPVIIDARVPDDLAVDPCLIPGSRTQPHTALLDLLPVVHGRRAVVSCHHGGKLSSGGAAVLRAAGVDAEMLEGGAVAWRAAGLPMVPIASLPASRRWVTRHRPKIDRIACPWLIRRFVDPDAEFLFVPPSDVLAVADRFDATPFDIEGVHWSHRDDHCTFDTMIAEFGLATEALSRLALVVRAADTDRHDLSPQAAGLLAISVGLSRQFRDDLQQMQAGMVLYDALYRWARDGFDEGHDWPAGKPL